MLKKLPLLLLLCSFELFADALKLPPQANDDYASVIVGTSPSSTGSLITNDLYCTIVTINGSTTSSYGFLTNTGGAYTYKLYTNSANSALAAGQVVTDIFSYSCANTVGQSASARLIVQVTGNPPTSTDPSSPSGPSGPVAVDDYASVIVGESPFVGGDMSANDRNGHIVTINGSTAGRYGFLTLIASFGSYTYTLYNNSANSALAAGQVVTDTFTYTYANDTGQSATARLIVEVTGNPSGPGAAVPVAADDYVTVLSNLVTTSTTGTAVIGNAKVAGNVSANDQNGKFFYLNSSTSSQYGYVVFNFDGSYTYTVYSNAPTIMALTTGQVVSDSFSYTTVDQYGQTATAKINVTIIGNQVDANGNTVFNNNPFDNVDVEPNNSSAHATPLNSARNIKGSLYSPSDKDWYLLHSDGNEIITVNVCPQGSSCFGQKNWELYVFDGDKLAADLTIEADTYELRHWLNDTGSTKDLSGQDLQVLLDRKWALPGISDHMYLAYYAGKYDGALIGILDPCFNPSTSLDIGVGTGKRNLFIAISTPLMGNNSTSKCGIGTPILQRAGQSVPGKDVQGFKLYTTTEEYISVFPYNSGQYTINITSTGLNPLLSNMALAGSATYNMNTGVLNIPKIRIMNKLYGANLTLQIQPTNGTNTNLKFDLLNIQELGFGVVADAFQATYNSVNQQLIIPRVSTVFTDIAGKNTYNAYAVILQYHPEAGGNFAWLEAIKITPIQ